MTARNLLITSAIHGEPVWVQCDELTEGGELLILPLTAPALERTQNELGICKVCGGRREVEHQGRTVKCFNCSGKSPSFIEHKTRAALLVKILKGWTGLVEVDQRTGDEAPFLYTDANIELLAARLDIFNFVFEKAAELGGLRTAEAGKD